MRLLPALLMLLVLASCGGARTTEAQGVGIELPEGWTESIYLWLAVQPAFEGRQEGRWLESVLPIRVAPSALSNLEGFYSPVEAGRWLLIDGTQSWPSSGSGASARGTTRSRRRTGSSRR